MSFGFSVSDLVLLSQLAWTAVQNSRKACGAHDELTQEVTCLHTVLQRLQREVEKPSSLLSRTNDGRLNELQTIITGCSRILKVIDQVLVKYNGMSEEKRKITRFRLKVQFGNGEMRDIGEIRQELSTYTSAITLFINLLLMGSLGKVEEHMETHGAELKELRQSLNWITASLQASSGSREGSILTSYADDDKAIWKDFRRELLKEGFRSSELSRHRAIIKDYVMELGSRGALDVPEAEEPIVEAEYSMKEEVSAGEESKIQARDPSTSRSELSAKILSWSNSDSTELIKEMTLIPVYLAETLDNGRSSNPISATQSTSLIIPKITNEDGVLEYDHPTASTVILDETDEENNQIEGASDSNESNLEESGSDEESLQGGGPQRRAVESKDKGDEPHGLEILDQEDAKDSNELCPIQKLTVTPKQPSIEEVEDEDFQAGAHPNCIATRHSEEEEENPHHDFCADCKDFHYSIESSELCKIQREGIGKVTMRQVLEEFGFDPFTSHLRKKTRSTRAVSSMKMVKDTRYLASSPRPPSPIPPPFHPPFGDRLPHRSMSQIRELPVVWDSPSNSRTSVNLGVERYREETERLERERLERTRLERLRILKVIGDYLVGTVAH